MPFKKITATTLNTLTLFVEEAPELVLHVGLLLLQPLLHCPGDGTRQKRALERWKDKNPLFSLQNRLQRRSLNHSQVTELRVSAHQLVSGVVQAEPLQQQSLLLLIWKDETRDCFKTAARVECRGRRLADGRSEATDRPCSPSGSSPARPPAAPSPPDAGPGLSSPPGSSLWKCRDLSAPAKVNKRRVAVKKTTTKQKHVYCWYNKQLLLD